VQTQRAERLANFQYAAPEQRIKGRTVDHRADIYALGLILNEMFTGETPLGTGFKPVSEVVSAYSYLDKIIERMIRNSVDQRPNSIEEIKQELSLSQQQYVNSHHFTTKQIIKAAEQLYRADVDCIGRIEDTSNKTVLSISAGLSHSISISGDDKQKALKHISDLHPRWGSTRRHVFLHTLLLFILIKDQVKKLDVVVIDIEYAGYEFQIRNTLLILLRKANVPAKKEQISFQKIDRSSPARQMASRIFKGRAEPDLIVGAKQIIDVIQ
jgi:serine/threonine protein kinase